MSKLQKSKNEANKCRCGADVLPKKEGGYWYMVCQKNQGGALSKYHFSATPMKTKKEVLDQWSKNEGR